MKRLPVASTNVRSIGYAADTATLEVEFRTGAVYEYAHVPEALYRAIISADSIGSALRARVKKFPADYPYKRIS